MDLVEELRADHQLLLNELANVSRAGVKTADGRAKLLRIKEALLQHLKKEDERLYPRLHERAQTEPRIRELVDEFLRDMEPISAKALAFFEKYGASGDNEQFQAEATSLLAALRKRVSREELFLYKEYRGAPKAPSAP